MYFFYHHTQGPYHREHLIKYMKEKALSIEDRDDPVPYIKKTRGKVFKSREEQQKEKDYLVTPKVEVSTSDSLQSKQSSKVNSAFAKELEDLFDGVDEEDLAELAGSFVHVCALVQGPITVETC